MRTRLIAIVALAVLSACGGGGGELPAGAASVVAAASPSPPPSASPTSTSSTSPVATASPAVSPTPAVTPTLTQTPSAAATPAAATGADLVWGLNGHPFTAYPGVTAQQQLDLLVQLGAKQYRVNLTAGAPTDGLEELLALATARGITILPIIAPGVSLQDDSPETIYARSRDAAFALGQHFAGRVKVWELGNELENYAIIQPCEMRDDGTQYPCTWGAAGGTSPLDYYGPRWKKVSAALHGMSDGLRAADPSALRAMGTAGWGHTAAFDRMAQDGISWDISVWHYYGCDIDDGAVGLLQHVAAFSKPIWITEFNCPSYQQGEDAQAAGLQRVMTKLRSLRSALRIEAAAIYELLDEPYWSGYEAEMGIVRQARNAQGQWTIAGNKKAFGLVQSLIAAGK